jgi:flagellar biosynthesis protein FlhA
MVAFLAFCLGVLPGMPALPFLGLSIITGGVAWYISFRSRQSKEEEIREIEERGIDPTALAEEPIATALRIDNLRLELGYGLLSLISAPVEGQKLTDQIKALRRQMATDVGFVMPSVRIQDNMQLPSNNYCIRVKEIEAGKGDLRPNMLLVMDPRGEEISLAGEKTTEPTFGLPAMWVEEANKEEALFRGYTVVEPATVITTHITEVIKDNMSELLSYTETQKLLDDLEKEQQKLISELIPAQISLGGVQRVLQNLLAERISIRDMPTILEGISEACGNTRNVMMITEHVRARLARQISDFNANDQDFIPLITLSPQWEQAFAESLVGTDDDKQLSMQPTRLQEFITAVRNTFERQAMMGEAPVLLTSPAIRPFVRTIIERFRPITVVMSQNEIHPKVKIKTVGNI